MLASKNRLINTDMRKKSDRPSLNNFSHLVQFYRHETELLNLLAAYFKSGIEQGDAFVVIATKVHLDLIQNRLGSLMDIDRAIVTRRFTPLDAEEVLADIMVGKLPDIKKFNRVLGGIMDRAAMRSHKVRATGEMVALLWNAGNQEGALKLEKLWNSLAKKRNVSLLCSYPDSCLQNGKPHPEIYTLHSKIITTERTF